MLSSKLVKGTAALKASGLRSFSAWSGVPMGPPDPILGLNEAFQADTDVNKISLGVGAYRDDEGKPYVLPSVRAAEKIILERGDNKEYLGITGLPGFIQHSLKFAYGDDANCLGESRVAATQSLSGTGAIRIVGEYLNRFGISNGNAIYQPTPTWGNHIPIFKDAGMDVKQYSYFDPATNGLDFTGMMTDIENAPDKSAFLLHACAHNPTGVDPTAAQWADISSLMKQKNHVSFFDCAYQGFASGDAEKDATAIRQFVDDGHNIILSQSYAKNFGLYGERVGCLSIVCDDAEEAKRVESQLKILIRPMYSNPPSAGARIVEVILGDEKLKAQWYGECKEMADRIITMRALLKSTLEGLGSTQEWGHITSQIGMFCYSGLSKEQVEKLRYDHHIYLTGDGRISMAGVTSSNVDYLASAIHSVTN